MMLNHPENGLNHWVPLLSLDVTTSISKLCHVVNSIHEKYRRFLQKYYTIILIYFCIFI